MKRFLRVSLLSQVTASLTRQQKATLVVAGIIALLVFIVLDISLMVILYNGWSAFMVSPVK